MFAGVWGGDEDIIHSLSSSWLGEGAEDEEEKAAGKGEDWVGLGRSLCVGETLEWWEGYQDEVGETRKGKGWVRLGRHRLGEGGDTKTVRGRRKGGVVRRGRERGRERNRHPKPSNTHHVLKMSRVSFTQPCLPIFDAKKKSERKEYLR